VRGRPRPAPPHVAAPGIAAGVPLGRGQVGLDLDPRRAPIEGHAVLGDGQAAARRWVGLAVEVRDGRGHLHPPALDGARGFEGPDQGGTIDRR
jgi:hypothetical protein